MAKPETVQATPTPEVAPAVEKKSITNWRAFEKAGLAPAWLICQSYAPIHNYDQSCHTKIKFTPQAILAHLGNDHGGGFRMKLKATQKPWSGWAELEAAGLEASDLRCEVCDKVLPFHPNLIRPHMRPHAGKIRRVLPEHCGLYNFTITLGPPALTEDEAYQEELNA